MATMLSLLVQSHDDYNSLVFNSTYGHLRVHSERMWCVKWTPDDRLVEWGREGGRNTGFSCVWTRVNRDSVPTLFCILLYFVYVTATFGEMGQGRSVTHQLQGYAVGTTMMTELNRATVVLSVTALPDFSDTIETCEICFLFPSCTLLMKGIRTDKSCIFMFIVY